MHIKSFSAGILLGIGVATATATLAKFQTVYGVLGVRDSATAICVDSKGEMRGKVTMTSFAMPIGDGKGTVTTGVTVRCP